MAFSFPREILCRTCGAMFRTRCPTAYHCPLCQEERKRELTHQSYLRHREARKAFRQRNRKGVPLGPGSRGLCIGKGYTPGPAQPTTTAPGTPERVAVYAQRAVAGEEIFCETDAEGWVE